MSSNSDIFLKSVLGSDFFEELNKTELWKPGTKSVVDVDDIRIGLKIVPRTILSFLIRELVPMEIGNSKEIKVPVNGDATLLVTKHEHDQYSGDILYDNKKRTEFKFRPLPGVGLVLMSALELYDVEDLDVPTQSNYDAETKIQKMIDERMALHDLVERVIDKKLGQREAVGNLMLMKLTQELEASKRVIDRISTQNMGLMDKQKQPSLSLTETSSSNIMVKKEEKKRKPLAEFLEKRKKPKEFSIQLAKGEEISCPDCGKNIFSETAFSGCICFGSDQDKKVHIKKSEDGVKIRFSRGWDVENIEMLLELLQKKNR